MELTNEQSQIEKLTHLATDAYIKNVEGEIKYIEEKRKLTLWIAGLSTALEIFILNKYSWSELHGFNAALLITSGLLFIWNSFLGLRVYQIATSLFKLHIKHQDKLNYQRILLINGLGKNNKITDEITKDFRSSDFVIKLQELAYLKRENTLSKPIPKLAKLLIHISDGSAATFFIVQVIVALLLLFFH